MEHFKHTIDTDPGEEELVRLKNELQASMEAIDIPENWESLLDENPYRLARRMGVDFLLSKKNVEIRNLYDSLREYAICLNGGDIEGRAHLNDTFFQRALSFRQKVDEIRQAIEAHIHQAEKAIFEANLSPERSCDEFDTKDHIIEMNRKSAEVPEDCWSPEKLKVMSAEEYLAHVAQYSSGRSFCHAFPMISFRKGEIVTGVGGSARSEEGFESVRDGEDGVQINFTPEAVDIETGTIRHRHYIALKEGGDVYFPAEALLDNYAMLNLPYTNDDNWVSSEWRNVAPPENPDSDLHAIPLELGIVFFDKSFEEEYRRAVDENPDLELPRVIFVDRDATDPMDTLGLNKILEEAGVNKQATSLPRIAGVIRPIDEINGISVFGTEKVAKQWRSD